MGTTTDVTAGDVRWLSPLPLWSGVLAGPIAWACDLGVSYALVKWTCSHGAQSVFVLITLAALVVVAAGAWLSWNALERTSEAVQTDGGEPHQRARFMAVLGLTSSALFGVTILAAAIPPAVLDACH